MWNSRELIVKTELKQRDRDRGGHSSGVQAWLDPDLLARE